MTILEMKSERKKKAILNLVKKGEYSVSYALMLTEELSDNGKLTDSDYEELATYLENLLNEDETQKDIIEDIESNTEKIVENAVESEEE